VVRRGQVDDAAERGDGDIGARLEPGAAGLSDGEVKELNLPGLALPLDAEGNALSGRMAGKSRSAGKLGQQLQFFLERVGLVLGTGTWHRLLGEVLFIEDFSGLQHHLGALARQGKDVALSGGALESPSMAVITSKLIVALVDQITAPARGVARVVKDLQAASHANAMQMNEMRGRMVDAAAAAWAVGKALADPIGKAVEFESAMADVAKVSDFSAAGLDQFGQDLRKLSTSEIPMAVTELAALAENAAAAGIEDSELLDFTRLTAKAALAWGVSGAQAGEDLAKIREALRLTTDERRQRNSTCSASRTRLTVSP